MKQPLIVKMNLVLVVLSLFALSGLAVAKVDSPQTDVASFEVFHSIRKAEALAKGNLTATDEQKGLFMARTYGVAEDYVREVWGSPIPTQNPGAAWVIKNPLPPLPDSPVDNGSAPLPITTIVSLPQSGSSYLAWPMRRGIVSSRFGMRWGRLHQGTDIAAPFGTPILAAGNGKVLFSGWEGGYGELIIVDHGNGTKTKYGHCSLRLVKVGQSVRQGDIIGKVGSTGHSTGPHLHYEVIRSGQAHNPEKLTTRLR